jgi:predicted RNA-binding Zn ribbon-like protein
MRTEYYDLEIIADFFNTHDKRMRFEGDTGIELLKYPKDLYSWLLKHHLISEQEEVTEQDLELAIKLRTDARKIIKNNIFDDKENGVDTLNRLMNNFKFTINFFENSEELQPFHTNGKKGIARLIVLIFELKRKELWHRIRICSAYDCQWVFVDHSRPGTGKWCSMKACGNRAKNKAYRQRNKP